MERRNFLKFALGIGAGAAALAATAKAAPLSPHGLTDDGPANPAAHPAVTSGDEASRLKPEEVGYHGHHHRHGHWHRRHWHRRHHRRHWRGHRRHGW